MKDPPTGSSHGSARAPAGLDAIAAAGLTLRRCIEPRFGHAEVEMQQPAAAFVPEATAAAYLDLPAALVWDLAKEG